MIRLLLLLPALAFLPLVPPAAAADDAISDSARAFFLELKRALLAGDREWVAAHVCLPLQPHLGEPRAAILTKEEFLKNYERFVTVAVVDAVRRQSSETLLHDEHGVMIGDGEIWFAEFPHAAAGQPSARTYCISAFGPAEPKP